MTFPWLICFCPWLPFSHGFRYGYDCVSQHARQSQTRKLPQPWEEAMGFAVRVRSAGQKYGPTCHQRDRADVTEFVTLVRLSSLGQHFGVLALAGYKRRKSALTAGPVPWLFQDFLGNFHIPRLFHDFPWQLFFQDFPRPWEPWVLVTPPKTLFFLLVLHFVHFVQWTIWTDFHCNHLPLSGLSSHTMLDLNSTLALKPKNGYVS